MSLPYTYKRLLSSVEHSEAGRRLAQLSLQTKIERFLLAELVFRTAEMYPDIEGSLEERPRRDFTVRRRADRALIEWVEAKMCYSDCVARHLTGHRHAAQYSCLVAQDAVKQRTSAKFVANERSAVLSTVLFVVHREAAAPHQKYYSGFTNRHGHTADAIIEAARSYCRYSIPDASERVVAEDFEIDLDEETQLLCFVYRDKAGEPQTATDDQRRI